jgi:hypothetical protein
MGQWLAGTTASGKDRVKDRVKERTRLGQRVVVVLDLDGTLMTAYHGSPIFRMLEGASPRAFAPSAESVGCIRPGVDELARVLTCASACISHVVLCTFAKDQDGYVAQAVAMLHALHGSAFPSVVIDRGVMAKNTDAEKWARAGMKCMAFVREVCGVDPETLVVVVEDTPTCIRPDPHTLVLPVPSFDCAVDYNAWIAEAGTEAETSAEARGKLRAEFERRRAPCLLGGPPFPEAASVRTDRGLKDVADMLDCAFRPEEVVTVVA